MSRHRTLALVVLAAIGLLALASARDASAIPAFARKYQISCSTCHAPFPRLKPYGEDFAGRGFRMEDPSKEPTRATYDTGDPWLQLARELPLAIRLDGYASWKEDAAADVDSRRRGASSCFPADRSRRASRTMSTPSSSPKPHPQDSYIAKTPKLKLTERFINGEISEQTYMTALNNLDESYNTFYG